MAVFGARTKEEQKFQHCNYGYDTTKYKSFEDCMTNYYKFNTSNLPDKLPIAVKPTSEIVKQQNLLKMQNMSVLTAEDRFYESLGIKYHNTHMFGVASRQKGRLLLLGVLVAGYFAYKKFKK